jgi:hypothetical protein
MYNEIFSGYQPLQIVEWRKNQRLEDHLRPSWRSAMNTGLGQVYLYDTDENSSHFSTLRTRTEMVLEALVFSPFNNLTWLVAREDFIKQILWSVPTVTGTAIPRNTSNRFTNFHLYEMHKFFFQFTSQFSLIRAPSSRKPIVVPVGK